MKIYQLTRIPFVIIIDEWDAFFRDEKSNKDITGLPQAMINEFFKRHYLEYPYLNREDDMGIDNLRISKLSYNPVFMIDKYYINV